MLYLNSPYFVIDGVSIFPDDSDPLQFYYLPMMPHLTMVADPVTNKKAPQLQLIEYTGSAGTGGFLNFDVNLGLDDDTKSSVSSQLQQQAKLTGTPKLSPVTFVDGTVKLLILGAQSADSGAQAAPGSGAASASASSSQGGTATTAVMAPPASGTGPQFVTKIQNATKPALYGDNQATFSVQLDQYGATVLAEALQGQMAPIAVIYSLQFLGLRPAFKVRLTADWNRVQTYLDSSYSGGFLFFSSDIEKTVDKLVEQRVINIEVDTFVTDNDLGSTGTSARDQALAECYELVKTNFFESSLAPPTPGKPDTWAGVNEAVRNVSDIALTGGAAAGACFSYKSIDLTRTDQKSLDFNVTEKTAVLRTIYPQGHLGGLLDELTSQGMKLSDFIVQVDLDNPYFERRTVAVVTHADFDYDQIASIDVNFTYGGLEQSVSLTSAVPQAKVDWNSVLVDGAMQKPVSYTYVVNFKGVDTTQRPGVLTSPAKIVLGDVLSIDPRGELYGITVVPIRALGIPFDRYPSVEVETRYVDKANKINLVPSTTITSTATEIDWPLFMCDTSLRSFDYRLTYALAAGGTTITDWKTTDAAKIDVLDPFPSKLSLSIIAALDWSVYQEAYVFVAYPSKDSPTFQQSFVLNAATPTAAQFSIDRESATQTSVYYEARLIKANGQVWTVPGSVTSDQFLLIQDGMKGHQTIAISPQQVDFNAAQVDHITVQLRYVDPANRLDIAETVTISSATDVRAFAFDYTNAQIAAQYRADIALTNGQTNSIDWTTISGATVVVPLAQLLS